MLHRSVCIGAEKKLLQAVHEAIPSPSIKEVRQVFGSVFFARLAMKQHPVRNRGARASGLSLNTLSHHDPTI